MTGTPQQIVVWLMAQDSKKRFDVKEHKEKRSLDQNAYYWKLNALLARKLHISTSRLHNMLLRDCSPKEIIDGHVVGLAIPDTTDAEERVLESETYHLKPTDKVIVGKNDVTYRWYELLKGSSSFNTAEMSALLDNLIERCKEQDIETLSPNELARMRARAYAQENKSNGDTDGRQTESMGT